jgi:DNA-binding response OmpR family regulator
MSTTWMLIEDEPDLYDMILAMYDMLGVEGVAFATGRDAMDWIANVEHGLDNVIPELALVDIRLPDETIDGVHIASQLRKSKLLGNIAICMITAYKFSEDDRQAIMRESGADDLLYKPLPKLKELDTILRGLIAKRHPSKPID